MSLKTFFSSFHRKRQVLREWFVTHKQQIRMYAKTCLLVFFCSSIFFVGLYRFVRPLFTPLMVLRTLQQIDNLEMPVWKHQWVPIEDISPYMIYAVIAAEDNKFVSHFGFDVTALQEAIENNLSGEGSLIGGSTITQQTAKNVFLWPNRDFLRKGLEAYFSLLMEALRSKERIMEMYLNEIEFGNGIYGVEAAARYYFNTSAKRLTSYQASLLAAILPNPRYYQNHLHSYRIQKRKNQISNGISRVRSNSQTRTFVRSIK